MPEIAVRFQTSAPTGRRVHVALRAIDLSRTPPCLTATPCLNPCSPPLLSSIATAARILYTRIYCSVFLSLLSLTYDVPWPLRYVCLATQGPVEGPSPYETGVVMDPVPGGRAWRPACNAGGVSATLLVVAMSYGLTRVGFLSIVPSLSPAVPASLSLPCRTALLTACRTFSTRLPSG